MENRLTSPIPKDTRKALSFHNWQIDNIALLLNKYLDFCVINSRTNKIIKFLEPSKVKQVVFLPTLKNNNVFNIGIKKVFEINDRKNRYKIVNENLNEDFVKKFKEDIISYKDFLLEKITSGEIRKNLVKIRCRQEIISDEAFLLITKSRLVVGLGSGSVLETSIKLHHIYGIPYIPASAIKGVLRAYKILELAEKKGIDYEKIEERIEENKPLYDEERKIIEIFGNQQQKGKLIILDSYPVKFEGFDIDVMNPHFPDYYDDKENKVPPADWQNPRPITFLAIPKNTEFIFYFKNSAVYKDNLKEDLKNAFEIIGIGGKTALGYGILGEVKNETGSYIHMDK